MLTGWDAQVFQALYGRDPGLLTTAMLAVTFVGNGVNMVVLVPFLVLRRTRPFAAWLTSALTATAVLVFVLKLLVRRGRPFTVFAPVRALALDSPTDFSFPSGHAAGSFCCALFLVRCLEDRRPRSRLARAASAALVLLAASIGVSRVVLGFHYPLDVTAGALLGASVGAFTGRRFTGRRVAAA